MLVKAIEPFNSDDGRTAGAGGGAGEARLLEKMDHLGVDRVDEILTVEKNLSLYPPWPPPMAPPWTSKSIGVVLH